MFTRNYKVELDVFTGPLDLLLHLIKKDEVDIYDIPISVVTDKYLEYIDLMRALNLDVAGDFLVMAATLTHIKSKMLLPIPEEEEEEEDIPDPREELMRRLIMYKMFKEASEKLAEREILGRDVFKRGRPLTFEDMDDGQEEEALAIDSTIYDLMDAFKDILKRFPKDYKLDLTVDRFRLTDKINIVMDRINSEKSVIFRELFPDDASRGEVVITFLAILELAKGFFIKVFQSDEGTIRLFATSDEERKLDLINESIEEYSGGPNEYEEDADLDEEMEGDEDYDEGEVDMDSTSDSFTHDSLYNDEVSEEVPAHSDKDIYDEETGEVDYDKLSDDELLDALNEEEEGEAKEEVLEETTSEEVSSEISDNSEEENIAKEIIEEDVESEESSAEVGVSEEQEKVAGTEEQEEVREVEGQEEIKEIEEAVKEDIVEEAKEEVAEKVAEEIVEEAKEEIVEEVKEETAEEVVEESKPETFVTVSEEKKDAISKALQSLEDKKTKAVEKSREGISGTVEEVIKKAEEAEKKGFLTMVKKAWGKMTGALKKLFGK